jgi:excinuclease ABC subunit A
MAQGSFGEVAAAPDSPTGQYLSGQRAIAVPAKRRKPGEMLCVVGASGHNLRGVTADFPLGCLTCVTGVSGSGKTTLALEGLVPALEATLNAGDETKRMPAHVWNIEAADLSRVNLIDSTPIGANVRSTVATYSGVLDDLRRAWATTPSAKAKNLKMGAFSYNTGSLRCPTCDGTGTISLDVQFLPDVDIVCPDCRGSRYSDEASQIFWAPGEGEGLSLPEVMKLSVDEAIDVVGSIKRARAKLETLSGLGLGYLTLGEATPTLSGGEAQRLKLASEMGRKQTDTLFVFDEPTIGLHPLDVATLLSVLERLVQAGATVVVIEHDLDMISNADWVIDLGPGGGAAGGEIVVAGTPEDVAACERSVTGRCLAQEL